MTDQYTPPSLADLGQRYAQASEKYNPQDVDHMARAQSLANRIGNAEKSIPILEEAVKILKARREALGYEILELMDEAEASKTNLNNGLTLAVEVSPSVDYGLPEDADDEVASEAKGRFIAWLSDNGEAASVKEIIQLKGGVETEKMEMLTDYLAALELNYSRTPSIHPQTLKKILKTRISTGADLPPADIALVKMHRFISVK